MFENVDGRWTDGRTTDAGVTGILYAHLRAFGSGELKMTNSPGCKQQRLGSDYTAAKADACLYPTRACFTHFDTRILDYKTTN